MFLSTKMSEFMMIHPSHFGCVKSSILTRLKQMCIDSSCSNFSIGIKTSDVSIGPSFIDPSEGCCVVMCIFLLTHIIPKAGNKLSFDDTEEKVAVRFEDEKGQDAIYEITSCRYLKPENELHIDPSIRSLCIAHSA